MNLYKIKYSEACRRIGTRSVSKYIVAENYDAVVKKNPKIEAVKIIEKDIQIL